MGWNMDDLVCDQQQTAAGDFSAPLGSGKEPCHHPFLAPRSSHRNWKKCHWETSLMIKMAPHLTILPCYKFKTPMNTIVICDCCLRSINFFLLELWSNLSRDFGPSEVVCVPHRVAASAELWLGRNLWVAESIPTRERRTPRGDLARASEGCYPPLVDD
jgi:hypothetical protein